MMAEMTRSYEVRRSAYEALAYYAARAEHALEKGDMVAHSTWARKYHELRSALG